MSTRMGRRRFLQISLGGTAGAFLVACGQAPSASQVQPTSAPVAPEAATSAANVASGAGNQANLAYKGNVEFWDWEFPPRQAAEDAVIAKWKETYPDITIKYIAQGYEDTQTKLLTAASAGNAPPFSNVHAFWRPELQRAGLLAPYPDDLFDFNTLISTPFNRDPTTGKVYTSLFAHYTDQVYYNLNLLEPEGIKAADVPRTWDDFMKLAEQLTKRDTNGKLVQAGWSFNHYYSREWLWTTMVYQQGGWLWSEDGTQALWNEEPGVNALQRIQDVYYKHKVDDPDFLGMFDAWGSQKAATYISQGYTGASIDTNNPDIAGRWGTAVTPTFTGEPGPAWGLVTPEEGFAVFANASQEVQEVAFAFIKDLMGTDEQRIQWALLSNGPPDSKDLLNDPRILEKDKGNSIATQAETLPWRINYGERPLEAEKIWRAMFDQVILEQADPKQALDSATEQMNAALKESGKKRLFTERNYTPPQG